MSPTDSDSDHNKELLCFVLRLGDSTLIASQRLAEWAGIAPTLEEDIAFANIALDLLGQARHLLSYASQLEGKGQSEDDLAFLRDVNQFYNYTIVEIPNGDFAQTCAKMYLFTTFLRLLWDRIARGADQELKAIAQKSINETKYHIEHFGGWLIRLGNGTSYSADRLKEAFEYTWPYVSEFFSPDPCISLLAPTIEIDLAVVQNLWLEEISPTFLAAKLPTIEISRFISNGKIGLHSEHLGHILAEMQFLQRAYPGGRW
jgi:ring-1,2-phenylacetyl-CoA epoxidase subunit PaaC